MLTADIKPHRTYETKTGYRHHVQGIDWKDELLTYAVVRGPLTNPIDCVGREGETKLADFAKRVDVEVRRQFANAT